MISTLQLNGFLTVLELTPVSSDRAGWLSWLSNLLQVRNAPSAVLPNESFHDGTNDFAASMPFKSVLAGAAAGEIVDNEEQQRHPVAVFGVAGQTKNDFCKLLLTDFCINRYTTVDTYNVALGIQYTLSDKATGNDAWEEIFHMFLDNIIKIDEYAIQSPPDNMAPQLIAWRKYLYDNKDKLDPVIRINDLMNKRSKQWKQDTIQQFILKNSPAKVNFTKLTCHLNYFIKCLGCTTTADLKKALADEKKLIGGFLLTESDYRDLAEIYQKHFFRNTSKLGLTFFASRGYDIVFSCNLTKDTLIELNVVVDKPWKRGERRSDNYEPYTISELRCVLRDKSSLFKNDNVYAGMLTEEEIAFSKFLSEEWYGFPFAFDAADDK